MRSMTENEAAPSDRSVPPAPGADRYLALDFANSDLALPGGRSLDLLGTPEAATRWLIERGLASDDARLQEVCARRLRDLREQVGALIATRIDALPAPPEALRAVNDALTRAPAASLLAWDRTQGLHRAQAHPADQVADHALAVLAADAADLLTSPDADLLAACGSPPCRRYLLRTHGRRHWCSVRCGDRARAARAYARRTATP
ncbi:MULTISPECIES: ABATE domain-containing protein [Streptacidiphilus]|uniref:ABATE domain-containing protein n=2 Tax=Streptacidiphilus TaxID=228398 RepID=A0ABV6UPR8_9ACTN|nr:ABATE domain-containing protein [Streptacidiphilus jeojiense]